jgi:hypothetical protein
LLEGFGISCKQSVKQHLVQKKMKAQDEQKKEQIKLWKVSTPPPPKADDEEGSANGDQNK